MIYNYVYVVITLSITYILAVWYVITYRDIVFGKCGKFSDEKRELKYFFKVGVPLLLANLIGQILFVVDQQFVNLAFDNDTYAVYAFAYNMINLITVATSAISVVLYPTLKTLNADSITRNYSKINSYLLIFVALCLAVYYPLVLIVTQYLPKYVEALPIFLIILPGVLISSSIAVVKYNCYKTFNKINNYFVKSLIILCIAILADLAVYFIFGTTQSISIVSIGVLFIWYIVVEAYFIRAYKVSWIRNLLYIVLILGGFYGISFIPSIYGAFGAYIGYFLVVLALSGRYLIGVVKDALHGSWTLCRRIDTRRTTMCTNLQRLERHLTVIVEIKRCTGFGNRESRIARCRKRDDLVKRHRSGGNIQRPLAHTACLHFVKQFGRQRSL